MSYSLQTETIRKVINDHLKPSSVLLSDPSGISHKGVFFHGGNVKTGKLFFDASGESAPSKPWTLDTLYNWASCGKLIMGVVAGKMMEEGLILPTDKCSTYWSAMSGTGNYITNVDFAYPTANPHIYGFNPLNPADITLQSTANVNIDSSAQTVYYVKPYGSSVNTSTFSWSDITISDLLRMDIGIINDGFVNGTSAVALLANATSLTEADLVNDPLLASSLYQASILANSNWFLPLFGKLSNLGSASIVYNIPTGGNDTVFTNAISNRNIETYFGNIIELNKSNVLPAMYKPGTRYTIKPYNVNAVPATYDTGYILLGIVLDKILRTKLGLNFAQFTRDRIFTPCNMTDSYIVYQDDISSPSIQSRLFVDSFRRAPALTLGTSTFNFTNPALGGFNPLGYGCDASYNAIATAAVGANPYWGPFGPLVWATDFKNDGIYKLYKGALIAPQVINGSTISAPYGSVPLLSSVRDFGKLLQMMANKGVYRGRTIINTETWSYITSIKVSELTLRDALYPGSQNDDTQYSTLCVGNYKPSITGNTYFGTDESTRLGGGATGCYFTFDYNSGNWFVYGMPESLFGTGNALYPSNIMSQTINQRYIIAMNTAKSITLPM